ncbi:CBS domain-containing protein [bacterium]|nr:CBS domain-containing protein [bacterium]
MRKAEPFQHLNKIIYNKNVSLKKVLEGFNETAIHTESSGFAIIIDDGGKCIGVVSDGDIRRKLVEDIPFHTPVSAAMNKNYVFVKKGENDHVILRQFDKNYKNLPVLNDKFIPVDLYRYSRFLAATRTVNRIIRARVPVRVSFSGGGTDISSYIDKSVSTVLSSTINKYCTASVIVRDDKEIHIKSKDLNLSYTAKNIEEIRLGDELDLIKAAIKIMQPDFGFILETSAEFEPGTGLGGSSAVVVSVLGALNYFRNEQQLDIYQLADLAYQVERIDLKIDGGWQDQYATIFGGFSWIEFNQNGVLVSPLRLQRDTLLELEYNLMLFRLGKTRNSGELQKKHIESSKMKSSKFAEMIKIAKQMKDALLKGEVKRFADMLHESWLIKQRMNEKVSNKYIEECYNTARNLGALGGKLLGAGGSGYLLIYSSPLYQRKINNALKSKGAQQELFKFSNSGLEVWSTKN